jgi:hypothetical protein
MTLRVPLSHGIWRDGEPLLDAELRELAGTDEESLAGLREDMPAAARVSELLARTITRLGDLDQLTSANAAELTVGDRERLLLHLYAENFARKVKLHADCAQCGEQIDADVAIADLFVAPDGGPRADYELSTDAGELRFRLPRGADQEAAGTLAHADIEGACELLVQRCIVEALGEFDAAALLDTLAERFAELDPQAETMVQLVCPSCGATSDIFLDASTLVFEQLAPDRRLLDEVDSIARSYHWSEGEILALPTARRRAYLERIADGVPVA